MAVSQLAYLGIGVSDLARWRTFASDVLGMQVVEGASDGGVYLRMDECHHRIVLHPSGEDDVLYVGLQAATHTEYEQSKDALRAAGVAITQGTPAEITQRRVLDFVKFETGEVPFELCVVDNGSRDGTEAYFRRFPLSYPLRYERSAENVGLIRALNAGARAAQGELLCFLHNDTEMREAAWLARLRDAVTGGERVGLAGLYGARRLRADGLPGGHRRARPSH